MMNRPLALSAALFAALPFSASAAEKRAFAIADLYAVKGVAEPAIAPDGRSVAFAVTTTDLRAIRRQTNLWRVDADGKGARALTLSDKRDASPAFSPDGTVLAFLSTRAGDPRVFFLPTGGGEAEKKTDVPGGVGGFLFTPDGKRLVLTAEVWPECGADAACNRKKDEAMEKGKMKAHVADRLFVRHWDSWEDGKRTHVLVVDLADAKALLRDLTPRSRARTRPSSTRWTSAPWRRSSSTARAGRRSRSCWSSRTDSTPRRSTRRSSTSTGARRCSGPTRSAATRRSTPAPATSSPSPTRTAPPAGGRTSPPRSRRTGTAR
jgi:dipeptidyl aminopeptidase/acylaminoacyl peptidase